VADYTEMPSHRAHLAHCYNNLAWLLATWPDPKSRETSQAVALAKKAVQLQPSIGIYLSTLGAGLYRAGDSKAAIAALEKCVELRRAGGGLRSGLHNQRCLLDEWMELRRGGDAFDWFFLSMAHRQLGNTEQAADYFQKAVQWMDKNNRQDKELRRFRAEAAKLLGVPAEKKDSRSPMPKLPAGNRAVGPTKTTEPTENRDSPAEKERGP
jgi:tetratricopeptide (TPR) repeat protein